MSGVLRIFPRLQRMSNVASCFSTSTARSIASGSFNKPVSFAGKPQHKLLAQPRLGSFVQVRLMSADPESEEEVRDRVMTCLKCYDKINPETLTVHNHFMKDLGLDSLDHVEIIVAIENEFAMEIPDSAAELLLTPQEIIAYVCDDYDIDA